MRTITFPETSVTTNLRRVTSKKIEYLNFFDFTDSSGKFDRDYRCLEIEFEIVSCLIRLQNGIFFRVSDQSHLSLSFDGVAYSNVTLMALAFVIVPFL